MEEKLKEVQEILKKYNQEQLLRCYDKLIEAKKEELLDQILKIDFDHMKKLYEETKGKKDFKNFDIRPLSYIDKEKLEKGEKDEYEQKGIEIIKNGKYAVVTMAGGQGTRLGHDGPKGTFELDVEPKRPLFTLLSETIKEAIKKYNAVIPWYIMTSKENNMQTKEFFKRHNYFEIGEENIKFFIQNEMPMIDTNGKILVDDKGMVKQAADGHGGIFEAMRKEGVLDDMHTRGIEWIFIAGVDNVLAKMVDPILTGLAINRKCLAAGKSVVKNNPKEKVGVFCKKDNKPSVIEYTEITDEMAEAVDENDELLYGESHILCNLFNIKAIEEISTNKLPYHSAFKKAKYIDESGVIVVPHEPNAYKFEAFIFDAFERLNDMAIMRVRREEEFAPVKNAEGVDSPETAKNLYLDFIKNKK